MLQYHEPMGEMAFSSRPEKIRDVRAMVTRLAGKMGFDAETIERIELAVGEACANAVEHGSPRGRRNKVRVRCLKGRGRMIVEVEDQGCWRPPCRPAAGDIPLRGRGLPMMRDLVDDVVVEPTATGTHVRLTIRASRRKRKAA